MARISDYSWGDILSIQDGVREALRGSGCLESAAQRAANKIYDALSDSIALVRLFATITFRSLPPDIRESVQQMVRAQNPEPVIHEDTLVLTLLGSRGVETRWNSRRDSAAHAGIPLISRQFVEGIPMVARLLHELGVDLRWFDQDDMTLVERKLAAGLAGFFHVADAATAIDRDGRKIIPSQDFVGAYGIKTVFGLGTVYTSGMILSVVVFARDTLEKHQLEQYMPLINCIKAGTASLVKSGQLFEPAGQRD